MKIDTSELTKSANTLQAEMKQLQDRYTENAKKILGDVFGQYLRKYPHVKTLGWRQYTPFFSDGDPCEFGVHELCVRMVEDGEEYDEDDYGYGDLGNELSYTIREWASDTIENLKAILPEYEAWEKNRTAYATKEFNTRKIGDFEIRRVLGLPTYGYQSNAPLTPEQYNKGYEILLEKFINEYRPSYEVSSLANLKEMIAKKEEQNAASGDFIEDSQAIVKAFQSIPNDVFLSLYGDHVTVIMSLSENGKEIDVEVEEYEHD